MTRDWSCRPSIVALIGVALPLLEHSVLLLDVKEVAF